MPPPHVLPFSKAKCAIPTSCIDGIAVTKTEDVSSGSSRAPGSIPQNFSQAVLLQPGDAFSGKIVSGPLSVHVTQARIRPPLQQQADDFRIRIVVSHGKHQGAVRTEILPGLSIDRQARRQQKTDGVRAALPRTGGMQGIGKAVIRDLYVCPTLRQQTQQSQTVRPACCEQESRAGDPVAYVHIGAVADKGFRHGHYAAGNG